MALDADLAALGLDSLGLVTVVGHIEAAIGIELDVDETMAALAAATVAELAASLGAVAAARRRAEEGRG